jgi:uncharacterized protein YgiM (DUF1202 family)
MRSRRIATAWTRFASIGLLLCILTVSAAAETAPYQARVVAAGAAVRSGPGDNFYPTDTLSQGDLLEVYREKSGWLGIRPPINSFSWVAARDLIVKDGGLAEVTRDNVPSRIGSRVSDKRNASQVRLKKGEGVEVVGEETIGGEKWCKIAPPAGEFRWIQSSLVEKVGPIPARSKTASASAQSNAKTSERNKDAGSNSGSTAATPGTSTTSDSGAPPLMSDSKQDETASASAAATAGQAQSPPASGDLAHDLAAMEIRLSRMAAAPTNLWNTERLERDAAQLMGRAQSQAERDQVRAVQEKISHFAEIGRKATQSVAGSPGQPPITPLPNNAATAANGGPYDAVGILRPVVSRRPGAPQFALVDERGQVLSFVTATPDLNLQPYLGRKVGVVGNRGYMPEFQRASVTAARVTPLTDRLVR